MEDGIIKKILNFIKTNFLGFLEYAKNDFN